MRILHLASRRLTALWGIAGGSLGSQIAEFAISLPLLVLFVMGIFDFSGALTLKQKLTNAAREAARVAAADPANDLGRSTAPIPASIGDAVQVVDNYLLSEKINDCGLNLALPTQTTGLTWSATGTACPGGPSATLLLTINRGCVTPQTSGQTTTYMVNTCVTIRYPYSWRFNGVSGLFGRGFTGPSSLTATAVMFNEN
jgi:Flp pilus assembly protein TadG